MKYKYKIVKEYSHISERVNYIVYEKSFLLWCWVDYRRTEELANELIVKLKEMRGE